MRSCSTRGHRFGAWCLLISCLAACEAAKESFDTSFKQSFAKNFGESCTRGAVGEGAPEEKAKPLCECTATYLVNNHDASTLTKMGINPTSHESQQMANAAMQACGVKAP